MALSFYVNALQSIHRTHRDQSCRDYPDPSARRIPAVSRKCHGWREGPLDQQLVPIAGQTKPTDIIRRVRNFVHPGRYFKERAGKPYTADEVNILYATCHAAYECVLNRLREHYPDLPSSKL